LISLGTLASHTDKFAVEKKGYKRPAGIATDLLEVYLETKLHCIFIDILKEHYKLFHNPFAFSKT
jgi:hypothetical protein